MKVSEVKIGMKFGHLTVIDKYDIRYTRTKSGWSSANNYCVCKCDCGNNVRLLTKTLINKDGNTSCGHCHQMNLIGKMFKHLEVIGLPIKGSIHEVRTRCKNCGNEANTLISDLLSGNVKCYNCKSELVGYKFGRLTFIKLIGSRERNFIALTKCDCGLEHEVRLTDLTNGRITSCGKCYNGIPMSYDPVIHDRCVKLSKMYKGIKRRCDNPYSSDFHSYGGRGISLDISKYEFIMMFCYNTTFDIPGVQLDRINNNGNYSSTNLRLIPGIYNTRNRLYDYVLTYNDIASRLMTDNVIRGVKTNKGHVNLTEFYRIDFDLKTSEDGQLRLYVHYTLSDKLNDYVNKIKYNYSSKGRTINIIDDVVKPEIVNCVTDIDSFAKSSNIKISSLKVFTDCFDIVKLNNPQYDNICIELAYELFVATYR